MPFLIKKFFTYTIFNTIKYYTLLVNIIWIHFYVLILTTYTISFLLATSYFLEDI